MERSDFYSFEHYEYGEPYLGSCKGVRFRLAMEPLKNVKFVPPDKRDPAVFLATVWPEPYCWDKTDDSLKESREFPFTPDGLDDAVAWIMEKCPQGD